jgi:type VI secretion system secreted protein VgrG
MSYTQDTRHIAIHTPLGQDVLLLQSFKGHEAISQLFSFQCNVLSEDYSISFDKLLGQKATIRILLGDNSTRYINGFISSFSQSGSDPRFASYRMEVVPWLWFLSRRTDCRIFQNMTVPDIIKKVFDNLGFHNYRVQLQGSFPQREYCVQYRETDLNFVSRLMEQYGIFYFFEHEKDNHTLVLANSASALQVCPHHAEVRYEYESSSLEEGDSITRFDFEQEVRPGKYALNDFNFETPSTTLAVSVGGTIDVGGNNRFEVYDYPGDYRKKDEGEALVKVRMQEEETPVKVAHGSSYCRGFVTGYRFELKEHYRRDLNQAYVLTGLSHVGSVGGSYKGSGGGNTGAYSNEFIVIPYSVPFRPLRTTPRPVVQGPHTAIVSGKAGEEIWVDKYGRVKVQFHWDREGKRDENSSCWIRVSQAWAGKGWGSMHIPRIGQEVIVEFLEGDPDQPIITGRVYNAVEMPPYDLPAEQTKSTMKSLSSKGGGGFNEFRFEDLKGKEQIFIHAERDMDLRVKNDRMESIVKNTHLTVGADQFEKITGDTHLSVKGDQNEKVDGTVSLKAGMDLQHKVGMKYGMDAGTEIHLKAGLNLVIESGMSLTLKVGGNFINLSPAGIAMTGTMVLINSGGAAGTGSGSSPHPPKDPTEADNAKPGQLSQKSPLPPPPKVGTFSPAALVFKEAARSGTPFCDI